MAGLFIPSRIVWLNFLACGLLLFDLASIVGPIGLWLDHLGDGWQSALWPLAPPQVLFLVGLACCCCR
jgi:hypothetical protein